MMRLSPETPRGRRFGMDVANCIKLEIIARHADDRQVFKCFTAALGLLSCSAQVHSEDNIAFHSA